MFDRNRLLSHLQDEDERRLGQRIVDAAEQVYRYNEPKFTGFLDPRGIDIATGIVRGIGGLACSSTGGYRRAERQMMAIYPDYYLDETLEWPLTVLEVRGDFSFENVTHRDFLGSILANGIRREKVGDIIVTDFGCQVIVATDIASYLLANWKAVHKVPIGVAVIEPEQLAIAPQRVKEIRTTVASMRLDAVASSGFGTSRTKLVKEIKGERVKVNWQTVTDPSAGVKEGDVLSIRGRGRVVVESIIGQTRKGRISLLLKRLI